MISWGHARWGPKAGRHSQSVCPHSKFAQCHEPTTDVASMLLLILAYLGAVLTILRPCVLPVLLSAFSPADRPFARHGLPMLINLALIFTVVATVAAARGAWAVRANQYGLIASLAMFAMLGYCSGIHFA